MNEIECGQEHLIPITGTEGMQCTNCGTEFETEKQANDHIDHDQRLL